MAEPRGRLAEVFPSIQGEGLQVGAMQVFLRFAGCNLACRACDTRQAWDAPDRFPLRPWPGRAGSTLSNPVGVAELVAALEAAYPLDAIHSIALTGGEPLAQPDFVVGLARGLRRRRRRVFVETNGTLAGVAERLKPQVAFWSVDLKLSPGWGLRGGPPALHARFVAVLPPSRTYLKLVLNPDDDPGMIMRLLGEPAFRPFPLVVQPFAAGPGGGVAWESTAILEWVSRLARLFREVRWIPQMHKLLRIP